MVGGNDGIFVSLPLYLDCLLGPTQPHIQWALGALTPGVKEPGCEADHTPSSSAKVKNVLSYTSTPQIHFYGVVLN
jgi:hypothetical protein